MTKTIAELNELLSRELGRNPYGEGVFAWEWSEDLFWPEFPTGQMIDKPVMVPIIGGGESIGSYIKVPEYRKEKMAPNLDCQWVITLWHRAEDLPQWQVMFPGAPYPARGHRIHTNASLPSYPGGPHNPNIEETERFIQLVKFQRSHTLKEAEIGIDDERTVRDAAIRKEIEDEIRDDMPAFMNIEAGKKGGYVSLPYTKKDRIQ